MKTPRFFTPTAIQISDPVVVTDTLGRVQWINSAFTRMCGYTLEELKGRKPGELLQGAETDPAEVATLRAAVRQRRPAVVELVNYRKNGEAYPVWISLDPLVDDTGEFIGFMAVERETTALHQRLRQLENEVTELYEILCRRETSGAAV